MTQNETTRSMEMHTGGELGCGICEQISKATRV